MYAVTMESYDDRPFDVLAYLKTPRVIVRLLSLVRQTLGKFRPLHSHAFLLHDFQIFSAIVFGCISDSVDTGYVAKMGDLVYASCAYHGDNRVCNYGVATGVIAFVGSVVFLIVDAFYEFLGAAFKKNSTFADLVFSAFWTLMWFVGFCYLADRWRVTRDPSPGSPLTTKVKNNARAAVAFSFFSVVAWVRVNDFRIPILCMVCPLGYFNCFCY